LGLSAAVHTIVLPSKVILFEASRYSRILLKVWYWICLGRDFHSLVRVGWFSASFMAFSTIRIVSRLGS